MRPKISDIAVEYLQLFEHVREINVPVYATIIENFWDIWAYL